MNVLYVESWKHLFMLKSDTEVLGMLGGWREEREKESCRRRHHFYLKEVFQNWMELNVTKLAGIS